MDYTMDLGSFVSDLKSLQHYDGIPSFIDTYGEKYIFDEIVKRCIAQRPIRVEDIDFEAFDEDDIVSIIDDKKQDINDEFFSAMSIVDTFENKRAIPVQGRRFF